MGTGAGDGVAQGGGEEEEVMVGMGSVRRGRNRKGRDD